MENSDAAKNHSLLTPPKPENIFALIITYNPDEGFPARVAAIINQVCRTIIVDNCSTETCQAMLDSLRKSDNLDIIKNKENLGIAAAQNQGISYAKTCDCKWVLNLDQDTVCLPDMVENLISAYYEYPLRDKLGMIGTNHVDVNKGFDEWQAGQHKSRCKCIEVEEVPSSGTLLPISVFDMVGPFREDLFIDLVDNEYCLRLKLASYKIIMTRYIGMIHCMGRITVRSMFGRRVYTYNYDPIRSYYRTRNSIIVFKDYFKVRKSWALNRLIRPLKECIKILLYEHNKMAKFKYTILGVKDAILYIMSYHKT